MQKVKIVNNWEYYEYYDATGKEIDPRGIIEIMDRDGKVYPVTCRKITVEYNDMGHTCTAKRNNLFVKHPLGEIEITDRSEFYIK